MNGQGVLMDHCKEKLKEGNLARTLANLLNVNLDAAYRRIRGDTALTFDEIQKICLHFNVSFDSVINFDYQGRLIPFQFNAMFGHNFQIIDYLKNVARDLKSLLDSGEAHILLTAMDMPYFRQFGFRSLSRFKLFFWQRSVLNLAEYRHKQFDHREAIEAYEAITEQIYAYYHGLASTEIWAPETLESTLKQVQYFADSGMLASPESGLAICDDMEALLDKLEREATIGKKVYLKGPETIESSFQMYQSDIFLSNNCVQSFVRGRVYTYVSFNSFNSLMSFSPQFSEECNRWIEQIRSKSILLSEVSEKLRYQFFLGLRTRLAELRRGMEEI